MIPLAAVAGIAADQLLGEPPARVHPVVWFGSAIRRVEDRVYRDDRRAGVVLLAAGLGLSVGTGLVLDRLLGRRLATVVATGLCAAGKMLDEEGLAIGRLLERGDLTGARLRLPSLVGRLADDLDETEISRAVIESLAENSVDAITSSLVWAAVGGAPAVLAHRAINTLDAMVGHRSTRYVRFGWASARLDDVVNYVPARLGAVAVALVRPRRAAAIVHTIRRDSPRHPSPNGGVIEAAFAAALDIRLGGTNRYASGVEDRGTLGDGPPPRPDHIRAAVTLRRRATLALGGVVAIVGLGCLARGSAGRPISPLG